ncbi:hypothetical protein [Pseudothauera rhizosphaerae]|uniref:Lipoprotein n=1 Tax=Pseudothauera rhizosphaerae TaxID=2565932 RepID=A0A4S4APL7_9RHOO|nr:hypothetical protein [Pseudothauera rhizosphaerae]THF61198.1 hypothetical protein E6O51_10255 [Pseudothauera rhizosphaerae]
MPSILRRLSPLVLLPLLAACENSATAFMVEGNQHAVVLVREQPYFWTAEVEQAVVVSRLPACQRKVAIHPSPKELVEVEVFEAGNLLWAMRQGQRWYLASTERCLVQDWTNEAGTPPGPLVGTFRLGEGKPVFVRAGQ